MNIEQLGLPNPSQGNVRRSQRPPNQEKHLYAAMCLGSFVSLPFLAVTKPQFIPSSLLCPAFLNCKCGSLHQMPPLGEGKKHGWMDWTDTVAVNGYG